MSVVQRTQVHTRGRCRNIGGDTQDLKQQASFHNSERYGHWHLKEEPGKTFQVFRIPQRQREDEHKWSWARTGNLQADREIV